MNASNQMEKINLVLSNNNIYPSPGFCLVVTIFKVNKQIRLRRHDKIHFVPLVDFFVTDFLAITQKMTKVTKQSKIWTISVNFAHFVKMYINTI